MIGSQEYDHREVLLWQSTDVISVKFQLFLRLYKLSSIWLANKQLPAVSLNGKWTQNPSLSLHVWKDLSGNFYKEKTSRINLVL